MKTYNQLTEAIKQDIRDNMSKQGKTYTLQKDVIMISKFTGIRKKNIPKIRVIIKGNTAYIVNDDDYESELRTMSKKDFQKLISNKDII